VVCPQALVAQNGALLIGLLFGYTLCYMPTLALTNNIAFHSLATSIKPSRWCACSAPSAGLSPGSYRRDRHLRYHGYLHLAALFGLAGLYSLTLPHAGAAKGMPVSFAICCAPTPLRC
jgi:hypothetical protein